MENQRKTEGEGASRIAQLIRKVGHNSDTLIRRGTVLSVPPNPVIKLQVGGIELDKDDLEFLEHITEHTREVSGIGTMEPAGTGPHTHEYEVTSITFFSPLEVGDEVVVLCDFERMRFVVLDKVVTY